MLTKVKNPVDIVLDETDHQLISVLRKDGRAPFAKLAKILGISRGTVQNRLDRLIETGVILGFTVRVKEECEANTIKAIMMINTETRSTMQILAKLRGIPELRSLHTTNGGWSIIANIKAKSLDHLDFIISKVQNCNGVVNTETNILLTSY